MRRFAQAIADQESLPEGLPAPLAEQLAVAPDHYNIGKGSTASVLARGPESNVTVVEMVWGLVPRWSTVPATPYTTVTARLERAPRSRIYSQAWQQRPCVIAMTGYYKWDRQRRPPWPLFVQRRDGFALLAAGLWEHWESAEGQTLDSFTVLTGPNPAIPAPLTPDGPVFFDPQIAMEWLAGRITSPEDLRTRSATPPLEAYPVSRAFRDPSRDDYTLLEPVDPDSNFAESGSAAGEGEGEGPEENADF